MKKNAEMKLKVSLLLMLILLTSVTNAQYFEGKIVYSNKVESKMSNYTSEQLGLLVGTNQEYFIKRGNYKSVTNSQTIVMHLYDQKYNRIYNKMSKSDTLYWFEVSANTDGVMNYKFEKNAGTILGYPSDALKLQTKTGVTTLYYNESYNVDSAKYANHNYNNWAFFISKTGALPLKIVIENNRFKVESTAIELKPLKLDDKFFTVESETPTKKTG